MTRRSRLLPWLISIALHGAVAGILLSTERPRPSHPEQRVEITVVTPPYKKLEVPPKELSVPVPVPVRVPIKTPGPGPGPGTGPDLRKPQEIAETKPIEARSDPTKGAVTIKKDPLAITAEGDPLALKLDPNKPPTIAPPIAQAPPTKPLRLKPNGDGTYAYQDHGFTAEIAKDGTVTFDGRSNIQLGGENSNGKAPFAFDITEALMIANDEDPFRYQKSRFLEETKALREEMCDRDRKEKLERSIWTLKSRLAAIWKDPTRPAEQRRRILFQLWDECAEPNEENTADVDRTAAMARATILAFIKEHLPEGSSDAYQQEELFALNDRRTSKQRFAPYD